VFDVLGFRHVVVYVVRHACAGHKDQWRGDDAERPLDPGGVAQAVALAGLLAQRPLRRLLSSPAVRCVETLVPLAERTGLAVETTAALGVDSPTADVIALLVDPAAEEAVFCTHGEVMRPLLHWLRNLGALIHADDATEERLLAKGTAWAVGLGDRVTLSHLAPLPIVDCPEHPDVGP
jgi:broad specificity phosphatase PhoE